jgi:hypothetical protein
LSFFCSLLLPELDRQIAAAKAAEDACWSDEQFNEFRRAPPTGSISEFLL